MAQDGHWSCTIRLDRSYRLMYALFVSSYIVFRAGGVRVTGRCGQGGGAAERGSAAVGPVLRRHLLNSTGIDQSLDREVQSDHHVLKY